MLRNSFVNPIQVSILGRLSQQLQLHFAEINTDRISSDQFSYHLRQHVRTGYVQKNADGTYELTNVGKSRAQMISPETNHFKAQGFIALRIVLAKQEAGTTYFLLQRRAKAPHKGMLTTPGGMILFGQTAMEAAEYYMKLDTGLTCNTEICGLTHFMDRDDSAVVQDRYFIIFAASNPRGKLLPKVPRGANLWLTYEQIQNSSDSLGGILNVIDMAQQPAMPFYEAEVTTEKF